LLTGRKKLALISPAVAEREKKWKIMVLLKDKAQVSS
jgi:hypothetical protein